MQILLLLLAVGFAADALLFSGAYTQHAYSEISTALGDAVNDVNIEVSSDRTEPNGAVTTDRTVE